MERFARLVMQHRRIVFLGWLVLFVAGGAAAGQLSGRLSIDFSLPGQPGDTAEHQMIKAYGTSSYDTFVATVTVPAGQTVQGNQAAIDKVFGTDGRGVAARAPGRLREHRRQGLPDQ